jgi:Uma2 family endonuclease
MWSCRTWWWSPRRRRSPSAPSRAPTLIVEILSPSTRLRARTLKAERYATLGVAHYWIVDPVRKTIECYRLQGSRYVIVLTAESPARMTHPDWPDLTIDLAAIWR